MNDYTRGMMDGWHGDEHLDVYSDDESMLYEDYDDYYAEDAA